MTIDINGPEALVAKASGIYTYTVKLKDTVGAESTYTGRIEFMMPKTNQDSTVSQEAEKPAPPSFTNPLPDMILAVGKNKKIYLPALAQSKAAISETVDLGDG